LRTCRSGICPGPQQAILLRRGATPTGRPVCGHLPAENRRFTSLDNRRNERLPLGRQQQEPAEVVQGWFNASPERRGNLHRLGWGGC
jgi:hypothetical protein